jgi:hypothetical protein
VSITKFNELFSIVIDQFHDFKDKLFHFHIETEAKRALHLTVRGFAQRGFQSSKVSKVTQISKHLDDFLKHQTPRCAKPLLVAVFVIHLVFLSSPFVHEEF